MTQLSPNFSLEEMTASAYATAHGIDNTPPPDVLDNLRMKTCFTLEAIRTMIGRPLAISSGYRCPAVNKGVGGAAQSAHVLGLAADMHVPSVPGLPDMSIMQLYEAIRDSDISYDQLIFENTWLHIGLEKPYRRQNLRMEHAANGGVLYLPGP